MPFKRVSHAIALVVLFTSILIIAPSAKAGGAIIITFTTETCTSFAISTTNSDSVSHNVQFIAGGATSANTTVAAGATTPTAVTFSFPTGTTISFQVYLDGSLIVSSSFVCKAGSAASTKPLLYNFMDGRCNQEPWQSFAIYPDGKGGWIFYAVNQGVGYYAMHVTKAFMAANSDTGVNHIIAQADGIQLWRLAGGLLQAHRIGMDGKDYSFNLDHCDGNTTAPTFPPPVPNTY